MSWCGIHGHDDVVANFRNSLQQGKLASTFLFVGKSGIGKRLFALKMAQALLCDANPGPEFVPCQTCPSCQQVAASTHPDITMVEKPEERSFIPISLFIGEKDKRNREGLCHWIGLKPAYGKRKVAIIDDADYLNQEGANCLLKTLEEPPPRSVLILIGTSQQRQLPTIRSRCQIVRFSQLSAEFVAERLIDLGIASDEVQAKQLAQLSEGSFDRALRWSDDEVTAFRNQLWQELGEGFQDSRAFAKQISEFVEAAGKDAPLRRERLRIVIEMFLMFFREFMNLCSGFSSSCDQVLSKAVSNAARQWKVGPELITSLIDRCVEADRQVAANANIATLIECWIDDLFTASLVDGSFA